jgi:hypothetical protein
MARNGRMERDVRIIILMEFTSFDIRRNRTTDR